MSSVATAAKPKKKSKEKGSSKSKIPSDALAPEPSHGHGRDEGVDPNWAYKPPNGMVTLDTSQVAEEFDWDSLNHDESKELWIVRLPAGFKMKHLDDLQIQQPRDAPHAKLATLERKRAKYDVWSVDSREGEDADAEEHPPRGEEIKSVSCLLPRKKKNGKLYIAPKPISQHIIIAHAPATPDIDTASTPAPSTRHRVPKHLLKHRFTPFGSVSSDHTVHPPAEAMEVDVRDDTSGKEEVGGKKTGVDSRVVETASPAAAKRTPKKKELTSLHPTTEEKTGKKRKKTVGVEGEVLTPTKRSKKIKL